VHKYAAKAKAKVNVAASQNPAAQKPKASARPAKVQARVPDQKPKQSQRMQQNTGVGSKADVNNAEPFQKVLCKTLKPFVHYSLTDFFGLGLGLGLEL
jgi:hypothetical protein